MNHPNREEWVPFLFNEAGPTQRKQLQEHLEQCSACRAEVENWGRTLDRLESWRLPRRATPFAWLRPAMQWAAAALILLGVGFGWGRHNAGTTEIQKLRASLESSLKADLQAGLKEQLRLELAGELDRVMEQRWNVLWKTVEQTREQDRQATRALLQQVQREVVRSYLSLRSDLETMASFADTEIREAQEGLNRLASHHKTESGIR